MGCCCSQSPARESLQSPLLNHSSVIQPLHEEHLDAKVDEKDMHKRIKQLKTSMLMTNKNDINIISLLDNFLYLLTNYQNDEQFAKIYQELGGACHLQQCELFCRNVNHRNQIPNRNDSNEYNHIQNIIDKIHCFYRHSYDIGNRLTMNEKLTIQNINNNKYQPSIVDTSLIKLNKILSTKRNTFNTANILQQRHLVKYNQLCDDEKDGHNHNDKSSNIYSFGYKFKYGFDGEYEQANVIVVPMYKNLKEELINTAQKAVMTIEQYTHEYAKASIHLKSVYCKSKFAPKKGDWSHDEMFTYTFTISHILSLMVYCNYTTIQYELSKTYRENDGSDHCNYYYFAKYLTVSVKKFGTQIKDGNVGHFYHGVNQQLVFPAFVRNVNIYSPLSTSSSLVVAANFAANNGLIIQFGDLNYKKYSRHSTSH
eukprot:381621_1